MIAATRNAPRAPAASAAAAVSVDAPMTEAMVVMRIEMPAAPATCWSVLTMADPYEY
jgi:hypothetical protein